MCLPLEGIWKEAESELTNWKINSQVYSIKNVIQISVKCSAKIEDKSRKIFVVAVLKNAIIGLNY